MIYYVVLASAPQQSESVIQMNISILFFFFMVLTPYRSLQSIFKMTTLIFKNLFIFAYVGSLLLCMLSLVVESGGCSLVVDLSLLIAGASFVAEHEL